MIFVKYNARLGNNLFQWAFGRVLSKLSGIPMSASPIPLFPVTHEKQFRAFILRKNIKFSLPMALFSEDIEDWIEKAKQGNILVQGYPHNIAYFEPHRDWLIKELTPKHGDYTKVNDNDIVLHVRLGDYFEPQVIERFGYPLNAIYSLLASLQYERCLIVTDTPDSDVVENIVRDYRGILVAKNIAHDYRTLYHASRLIISPSTFSWWAAWSGKAQEIYQPYEMGYWKKERKFSLDLPGPHVRRFNEEGKILYGIQNLKG